MAQHGKVRPVADDDLAARQVEREEGRKVLLHRDAPDIEEDRPRQAEIAAPRRVEQLRIHPARPALDAHEAACRHFGAERFGGHHHAFAGIVEAPQPPVAETFRDGQARADEFGKARVIGRGEGQPALQAGAPRGHAERTFRRNMDVVGRDRLDLGEHPAARRDGEADFRVGRQRDRRELLRRQENDVDALLRHGAGQLLQRVNDTVQLRPPGIRDDENGGRPAIRPVGGKRI